MLNFYVIIFSLSEFEKLFNAQTFVPPAEYRIVLVGRTGEGKSSTANSILGERIFEARAAAAAVTPECMTHKATVNGRRVFIVDTPGLFDTKKSNDEVKGEILKFIAYMSPGPHVILLVMKVGRYTKEVNETYKHVRDILGNEGHQHTIVVFTGGDALKADDIPIDDYFANAPSGLKRILYDAGRRYVVFNNRLKGADGQQQVQELLSVVDGVIAVNRGGWFKSSTYDSAEDALQAKESAKRDPIKQQKDKEESRLMGSLERTRRALENLKEGQNEGNQLMDKKYHTLAEMEREYVEKLRTLKTDYERYLVEVREQTRDQIKDGSLDVSEPWFFGNLKGASKKIKEMFGF